MSAMKGISVREFARRDACDEKLVRRAIAGGFLERFRDGSLEPALVGTGWRKTNRRRGPANTTAHTADKSANTSGDFAKLSALIMDGK